MRKEDLLPMNLQFFAEDPETKEESPKEPEKKEPEKKDEPESKDISEQLQQALVDIAKLKRNLEKSNSEAADYKRKWKESLSEQEKASMEKAEEQAKHDEEFAAMKRELSINRLSENFMELGYTKEQARKAGEAQVDGDTETLFKIQKEVQEKAIAEKEAEWLKSRPQIQQGGNSDEDDPFIKGFNSVKQYH